MDPRGVIEETYEGAAFGWVWVSVVLSGAPDTDFVHSFLAAVDRKWAVASADTVVAAARNWLRANTRPDDSPETAADLTECRRALVHAARCSSGAVRGLSHACAG